MKADEMVTIEVPMWTVDAYAERVYGSHAQRTVVAACKAALDARKSKYERWREGFPSSLENNVYNSHSTRQLAYAAPVLLDALINLRSYTIRRHGLSGIPIDAHAAIKAALPADVAASVLGDDQ